MLPCWRAHCTCALYRQFVFVLCENVTVPPSLIWKYERDFGSHREDAEREKIHRRSIFPMQNPQYQPIKQSINHSINQAEKNVFKWFQFLFSFCHSIVPLGTASCRWYWWRRRIFIKESTEVGLSLNPKLNIIFSIQFSSRILFK